MGRKDEQGNVCPSTLGEYRDLCKVLSVYKEEGKAVKFLDQKIAESPKGRDEEVIAPDFQMRALLFPMLLEKAE